MNICRIRSLVDILSSRSTCPVILQKRLLYEQTRSGSMAFERKKIEMRRERGTEMERFKKSIKNFKEETKWHFRQFKEEVLQAFTSDNKRFSFQDLEEVKMWDFNQANNDKLSSYRLAYKRDKLNDMNNWYVTCDSDFDIGSFTLHFHILSTHSLPIICRFFHLFLDSLSIGTRIIFGIS